MRWIPIALLALTALGLEAQTTGPVSQILLEYPRRLLECGDATPRVAVAGDSLLAESPDGSLSDLGAARDAAPGSGRVLLARGRSLLWLDCATRQTTLAFELEHTVHRVGLSEKGTVWALGLTKEDGSRRLTRIAPDGGKNSSSVSRPKWSEWEQSRISAWHIDRPTVDLDVEVLALPSGAVVLYRQREVFLYCDESLDCREVTWKSPRGDVCADYLAQRTEPPCPALTVASAEVRKGQLWVLAHLTGVADDEELTISRRNKVLAIDVLNGEILETIELARESRLFLGHADQLTLLQQDGTAITPQFDAVEEGAVP